MSTLPANANHMRHIAFFNHNVMPAHSSTVPYNTTTFGQTLFPTTLQIPYFMIPAKNIYRDNDDLKHSLRSLSKMIKWHTGTVFIVTPPDQVPNWLDTSNPR